MSCTKIFGDDKNICVFVYGTLMSGNYNHFYLGSAEFMGAGAVSGFDLYQVNSYPGAVRSAAGTIRGELYAVDAKTLQMLDLLESEGSLYLRETVSVRLDGGGSADSYIYIWNGDIADCEKVPAEMQPWGKVITPINKLS